MIHFCLIFHFFSLSDWEAQVFIRCRRFYNFFISSFLARVNHTQSTVSYYHYHHVPPCISRVCRWPVHIAYSCRWRRLLAFCILVGNNQTPHVYGMYYVQLRVHG